MVHAPHPATDFLSWLLGSAGAEVVPATEIGAAAPPWALTLTSADGTARYRAGFVGVDRPGWEDCSDAAAWGWGGLAAMTGEPDGPPLAPGAPLAAMCAAIHAMLALSAAAYARLAAADVRVALGDVIASMIEVAALRYAVDGSVRIRAGDTWGLAGWGVYHCRDGAIAIALRDPVQLGVLADLSHQPELRDARFADFMWGIAALGDEAGALITAGLLDSAVDEVAAGLRAAHIACAPVLPLAGLTADTHLRARGSFVAEDGLLLPRFPVRAPAGPPLAGPFAGEATASARPLAGVRVLDISSVWAGPMAARLLAELGAEVIKPERPGSGAGTFRTGLAWERSLYQILNDRNKQMYRCDFRDPAGIAAFQALVCEADVLIENFIPGQAERLGIDADTLHTLNPRLAVVSMPALGLSGPQAEAAGYGSTIEQAAGLGWLYADPEGQPHRSGINFSDPVAGVYAALGAVLALCGARERTRVEVSQQDAALSLMRPALIAFQQDGTQPRAVAAQPDGAGGWQVDGVPVRAVPDIAGTPDAPGSAALHWLAHPDGRDYPLPVLPWQGAFARAVAPVPATMPEPMG